MLQTKSSELPKVLLIDDDPLFCKTMQKVAHRSSVRMMTCTSAEAVSKIKESDEFDVVLLDYFVDKVTAPELLPQLRTNK